MSHIYEQNWSKSTWLPERFQFILLPYTDYLIERCVDIRNQVPVYCHWAWYSHLLCLTSFIDFFFLSISSWSHFCNFGEHIYIGINA